MKIDTESPDETIVVLRHTVSLFRGASWTTIRDLTLATPHSIERMMRDRLAHNARRIREAEAFSQEEVAERAGMSLRSYQRVEEGGTGSTSPRLLTIAQVAVALGVDPVNLLQPIG